MIRFPLAAAAALALGALSIAAYPSHQEPDAGPDPRSAAEERQREAVFVVRYDPSTIHLTEELVTALCRSSVSFVVPEEGFEGLTPGETYGLEVTALPGGERQPPGVFVARAYVTGAATSAPAATWTKAMNALQQTLHFQLVERVERRRRIETALDEAKASLRRAEEGWSKSEVRALEAERLAERADLADSLEREVEGIELERNVASEAWRDAMIGQEHTRQQAAAAAANVAAHAARSRELEREVAATEDPQERHGLEARLELERERHAHAMTVEGEARAAAARAARIAEKRATQLEELELLLRTTAARSQAVKVEVDAKRTGSYLEVTQQAAAARRLAATARTKVERFEARAAELQDALARLVDVTIERW